MEQGEVRIDKSFPYSWLIGFIAIGSQSVLHQTFLGGIGVIEEGRGHATIEGFIDTNGVLRRRVIDEASCNVREILVPIAFVSRQQKTAGISSYRLPFMLDKAGLILGLYHRRSWLFKLGREFDH